MGIFKGIKRADVKRAKEVIFSECWRNFDGYVTSDPDTRDEDITLKAQYYFASFQILYKIIDELNWISEYQRWKKKKDLSW